MRRCLGLVLVAWILVVQGAVWAGESKIADAFTPGQQGRKAGGALDGQGVEGANASWRASPALLLTEAGTLATSAGGSLCAKVPLPESTTVLDIQADLLVVSAKAGWLGIGFTSADDVKVSSWPGGVFMILDEKGHAKVFADGLKIKIAAKPVVGFQGGSPIRLRLKYDKAANTISAWAGEMELVKDYALDKHSFRPGLLYAGMSSYGAAAQACFDNFQVICQTGGESKEKAGGAQQQ